MGEKARDVRALAFFESLKDLDLVCAAFVGIGATEGLVDIALEIDADEGADSVFERFHLRL